MQAHYVLQAVVDGICTTLACVREISARFSNARSPGLLHSILIDRSTVKQRSPVRPEDANALGELGCQGPGSALGRITEAWSPCVIPLAVALTPGAPTPARGVDGARRRTSRIETKPAVKQKPSSSEEE